jgi:G3E family GTPase
MQILIISGFLGSGKTSILMPFVKQLSAKSKKVAIIENEIGEIGVDVQNRFAIKRSRSGFNRQFKTDCKK